MKEKKATQNEAAIKIVIRSKSLRGTTNSRLRVSPGGPLSPLQLVGTWFPLSSGRNTASDPHPPPPFRESNVVVRWAGASEERVCSGLSLISCTLHSGKGANVGLHRGQLFATREVLSASTSKKTEQS